MNIIPSPPPYGVDQDNLTILDMILSRSKGSRYHGSFPQSADRSGNRLLPRIDRRDIDGPYNGVRDLLPKIQLSSSFLIPPFIVQDMRSPDECPDEH